jgi:hypothetical protein
MADRALHAQHDQGGYQERHENRQTRTIVDEHACTSRLNSNLYSAQRGCKP